MGNTSAGMKHCSTSSSRDENRGERKIAGKNGKF